MASPLDRVPSELWSEIFGYTVASDSNLIDSRVPPVSTSQVCARWRGICHSSKFLWRNINLSERFHWCVDRWGPYREDHFLAMVDFLLTKRLEYARGAPLRIQIISLRKPLEGLVMKKLLLHSYLWQSVDLQMMAAFRSENGMSWLHHVHCQANVVGATPRLAGVKFPILVDVHLKAYEATSGVYNTINMIKAASHLRTVSLDMMDPEEENSLGGIKYRGQDMFAWSKLTDLKVSWTFDEALPPTLSPLTGLVNLSLQLFSRSTAPQMIQPSSTVVPYTLPSLKSLWMEGNMGYDYDETLMEVPPNVFLSQLKLPRLESLSVRILVFPSSSVCALIERSGCAIRSLSVDWCRGLDVTFLDYIPFLRSLSATDLFYPIVMRLVRALSVDDPAQTPKCPLLERLILSDEIPLLDDDDMYNDIMDDMESEDDHLYYCGLLSYRPHVMEILNLLEQRRLSQGPGLIPAEGNRPILDMVKLSANFSMSMEVTDRDGNLSERFRNLREGGLDLEVTGCPHDSESRVANRYGLVLPS